MRKMFCLALAVALFVPMASWAQDDSSRFYEENTEEDVVPARTIPKIEFSFGGGAGIGGYLAKFPSDPWLTHVGQSDDMLQDYMKFYLPKASLMPAGHAGFYIDFNFTERWGLMTGAELGLYFSRIASENLLNVTTNVVSSRGAQNQEYKKEIWVGSNLPGFEEQHRLFALQIPLMLKYMAPISPKGHRFYLAAGAKIGIPVISQYAQKWDAGKYCVFAFTDYPFDALNDYPEYLATFNSGHTHVVPNLDYGHSDMSSQMVMMVKENASWKLDKWAKIKSNPIDVMASVDFGFRWNLGGGKGLYTGLFCDFGLLRPIMREKGSKVLNFNSDHIEFQPLLPTDNREPLVSMTGSTKVSALAADAPDYCYYDNFEENPDGFPVMVKNTDPLARTLNKMQAGVKIRFAFGNVGGKRVRKAREPRPQLNVSGTDAGTGGSSDSDDQPDEVPEDIQQTMIEISNALFAFDKFNLSDEVRTMLDKVTAWLKSHPELEVEIAGHTDNRGSDEYNQRLSENRAKAVYDYFVDHGVAASRLSYKGYGESSPIATNDTDEGRQANRRVELKLK